MRVAVPAHMLHGDRHPHHEGGVCTDQADQIAMQPFGARLGLCCARAGRDIVQVDRHKVVLGRDLPPTRPDQIALDVLQDGRGDPVDPVEVEAPTGLGGMGEDLGAHLVGRVSAEPPNGLLKMCWRCAGFGGFLASGMGERPDAG